MKTVLRRYTPKTLWKYMSTGKSWLLDTADVLLGRSDDLLPPRRLIFIGSGDFQKIGNEFAEHFKRLAGLEAHHRVLDVGCGIGRMAIPLTKYFSATGSYEGFDIVPQGIEWCTKQIAPRFPNFNFRLADIRNKEYNPDGVVTAETYRFPYDDGSFDLVFATSVFTHMLPREVKNYLSEIARVLRPGGRCLITWFLLNPESRELIKKGRSELEFRYSVEGCLSTNARIHDEAIAYEEDYALKLYVQQQLTLYHTVKYGSWCGRPDYLSFQDICIAQKSVNSLSTASP